MSKVAETATNQMGDTGSNIKKCFLLHSLKITVDWLLILLLDAYM